MQLNKYILQVFFFFTLLALTVPSFWNVLRLNWNHVHKPCIYQEEITIWPKCCWTWTLKTCMFVPNIRRFGDRLLFSLLVHLPCWFICSFRWCLKKSAATYSMLHLWVPFILLLWDTAWVLLATPVLIPDCLHTSIGLWLACWTISKPGGGRDVVVILWFVNCFVMDCLNSRLIKY